MLSPSYGQCSLTSLSYLPLTRGDVCITTSGALDASQPMQLGSGTFWRSNFTDGVSKMSKHVLRSLNHKYKGSKFTFEVFHYWEGGIPVSGPIVCYEHERCSVTVTWNGGFWATQKSMERVTTTGFQNSNSKITNYVDSTKDGEIKFVHTFDGPVAKTIYFNQMALMAGAHKFTYSPFYHLPTYFWMNCSNLLRMDGIFGVESANLGHI
ncbi:hypothetical protein DSO57_1017513 [Entomophthora muscae]|uniref:Uncharacterized protein n=1 Tax=Entomophthora muscae TaxID=34485 RepID=A0ACC2T4Q8_9FUNG|nr:hypothetical protein DSO57_1017513 [Entomophthora muscae]